MTTDQLVKMNGATVTAKRLGWNDQPDAVREFDQESYAEKGYASPELAGELEVIPFDGGMACLVGGQEADPASVKPAEGQ